MNSQPISLRTKINKTDISIDFESRTITGVIAIEPIDIKDYRDFSIDDTFVNDLVALAKKQKEGVISNFGHNWNNLGRRLGRAQNWRVEDGKAKFDLHIYKSADKSPGMGNMGQYVLAMAEEDDKAIMNSIRFREDYFFQVDSGGKKLKVFWVRDDKGGRWVEPNPELGKVFVKIKELISTDIVDEGAATNSLLSTQPQEEERETIVNKVVDFFKGIFNQHPGQDPFPAEPAVNILSQQKSEDVEDKTTPAATTPAADPKDELLSQKDQEIAALKKQLEDQTKASDATLSKLTERIEKLEKAPAAQETTLNTGAGGDPETKEEPLWMKNPINQEAQRKYSKPSKPE